MLQQLADLTLEVDGRYADDSELNFIDEFVDSLSARIATYEKIKDLEKEIIKKLEASLYERAPEVFAYNHKAAKAFCRRDAKIVLRQGACAMLTNDYERLRESLLLWQRTIMLAFQMEECNQIMFSELMPNILRDFLTEEEYALILPALQLNENVLAY